MGGGGTRLPREREKKIGTKKNARGRAPESMTSASDSVAAASRAAAAEDGLRMGDVNSRAGGRREERAWARAAALGGVRRDLLPSGSRFLSRPYLSLSLLFTLTPPSRRPSPLLPHPGCSAAGSTKSRPH